MDGFPLRDKMPGQFSLRQALLVIDGNDQIPVIPCGILYARLLLTKRNENEATVALQSYFCTFVLLSRKCRFPSKR